MGSGMAEAVKIKKPNQLDHQETMPPTAVLGVWSDRFGTNSGVFDLFKDEPLKVTLEQVVEMRRRDGHARALMQLVLLPIRYALQHGRWEAPDVVEGDSDEEVDFANHMWTLPKSSGGMTQPSTKVIRQMLLAITDGFSAFEQVYAMAEDGPLKGKYILKSLSYCDPRTVTIVVDERGGFEGFRQRTHTLNGKVKDVHVKKENALVFSHQDELNPYYGVSMFESSYPHYEIRKKLYYIAHLAAQFAAVPGRIGKIPRGATTQQINEFKSALANFAFNTSMVIREGWEVTPFNGNSSFDFIKLIDHHRMMMSKSILAGFFDTEQRTVLIENATQDASADMFLLTLETIAQDFAAVLTDYMMPKFIDWNFGTKVYPKFVPAPLTDASKAAVQQLFSQVVLAGTLNCTPEMVREMEKKISADFDLDIDYDEIAKREQEAAEVQAEQEAESQAMEAAAQAAQAQGQAPGGPQGQAPGQQAQPPQGPPEGVAAMSQEARRLGIDDIVAMAERVFQGDEITDPAPIDAL